MGSLLGFLAEQQVSHDDPYYVNNVVEGLTGIDTTLGDSPFDIPIDYDADEAYLSPGRFWHLMDSKSLLGEVQVVYRAPKTWR